MLISSLLKVLKRQLVNSLSEELQKFIEKFELSLMGLWAGDVGYAFLCPID